MVLGRVFFKTRTPCHIAVHPNGHYAYVTKQLDRTVTFLCMNWATNVLQEMETVKIIPVGMDVMNCPANIHVALPGKLFKWIG